VVQHSFGRLCADRVMMPAYRESSVRVAWSVCGRGAGVVVEQVWSWCCSCNKKLPGFAPPRAHPHTAHIYIRLHAREHARALRREREREGWREGRDIQTHGSLMEGMCPHEQARLLFVEQHASAQLQHQSGRAKLSLSTRRRSLPQQAIHGAGFPRCHGLVALARSWCLSWRRRLNVCNGGLDSRRRQKMGG
jgi:hypothetical protein